MVPGELLPHLFTLAGVEPAVVFCHIVPTVTDSFPLGNMVLYVARTFLPHQNDAGDGPSGHAVLLYIINVCLGSVACVATENASFGVAHEGDDGIALGACGDCLFYNVESFGYEFSAAVEDGVDFLDTGNGL